MSTIYIATLGQRPEAITVAFDRLHEHYRYEAIGIIHTDPNLSGVAQAYADVRAILRQDYAHISASFHEITLSDGAPLLDIHDEESAESYYRGVLQILYHYKVADWCIHFMIAGGRKAMSIYAMLAASALFEPPQDRVWTVLSPEVMLEKPGQFHIPPGLRQEVRLVELPIRPARIAPGTHIDAILEHPISRRQSFLAKLTPAEKELVLLLQRNPYASNKHLAELSHKSDRTIENQLSQIYDKLIGFLDFGEQITNKRQALLDILREE